MKIAAEHTQTTTTTTSAVDNFDEDGDGTGGGKSVECPVWDAEGAQDPRGDVAAGMGVAGRAEGGTEVDIGSGEVVSCMGVEVDTATAVGTEAIEDV